MSIGSKALSVARRVKRIILGAKDTLSFPIQVNLKTKEGFLKFEAFSSVEHYRIAGYGGEKSFLDKFTSLLKNDDIVFDIGASVGLMTVHAAAYAKEGKVIAFEPDPETMERLKHNVSLNKGVSSVMFLPWAASDRSEDVILFTDGASGCAPTLREQNNRKNAPKTQITVQTKSIDNEILSGNLPLPTVLKIDIEGAEILCLRGAKKLISGQLGKRPRLIFFRVTSRFFTFV
ncbi:MAG: FkbM family methyltransferase [Leptolyngbyaceae cyanobacterium RM2_2_4]|nr:FkbM family methyltransferase [Leptolyngbyaceae cyanobacterium RM2_2_4]